MPADYTLAFAISWGGVLVVLGHYGFVGAMETPAALLPFLYPVLAAGPSIAGLLLTGLGSGRARLRAWGACCLTASPS